MSRIRSQNTSLESAVFKFLRKEKVYFRMHYRKAPGVPDIALPEKKKAIFIDGDFWHGWRYQQRKRRIPKVYWRGKIERNIERDRTNRRKLRRAGWAVMRIWEHQLKKNRAAMLAKIVRFLKTR